MSGDGRQDRVEYHHNENRATMNADFFIRHSGWGLSVDHDNVRGTSLPIWHGFNQHMGIDVPGW